MAEGTVLAAAFCLPKTNDPTVDILTGLAGPATLQLPVSLQILGP